MKPSTFGIIYGIMGLLFVAIIIIAAFKAADHDFKQQNRKGNERS